MKTYFKIIAVSIALSIVLGYGCTNNQPNIPQDLQESFQRLFAVEDMNESLRVRVDASDRDNLKFESNVHIVIENLSSRHILIPEPEGIKLLLIRNNRWVEIDDGTEYYGNSEGPVLYPIGFTEFRDQTSTWIHPILKPGLEEATGRELLRVVIIGKLMTNGEKSGTSVGAYVDVFINP